MYTVHLETVRGPTFTFLTRVLDFTSARFISNVDIKVSTSTSFVQLCTYETDTNFQYKPGDNSVIVSSITTQKQTFKIFLS